MGSLTTLGNTKLGYDISYKISTVSLIKDGNQIPYFKKISYFSIARETKYVGVGIGSHGLLSKLV